jgi:hypothetical protein
MTARRLFRVLSVTVLYPSIAKILVTRLLCGLVIAGLVIIAPPILEPVIVEILRLPLVGVIIWMVISSHSE